MRFTPEEKSQIVTRYYNGESILDISTSTGIPRSTLYSWLKPYRTEHTDAGYHVNASEFIKMKKHLDKLEQIIEVLQKVECTVSSPLQDKLQELSQLYGQYSVYTLCEALQVPRGTFYNHMRRNKKDNSTYQIRRAMLSEKIRDIFDAGNQIYGANKITAILQNEGEVISVKMVSELMQEMGLGSIRQYSKRVREPRKKKTDVLKMKFTVNAPNEVWVSDTTRFRFEGKVYYICVIIDLFARKAIAHKVSLTHSTQLITATFRQAYAERQPKVGLIFHSDRGAQYISYAMQKLLKACHVEQSFSPSGSPHHNAVMEAFFASMKKEELYRRIYHSADELRRCIDRYITFYNTERPHTTLKNKTPDAYEAAYFSTLSKKKN